MNTEEALKRKERETPRDRELCSYGFKFEQYMSVSRPGAAQSEADTGQPVNENTEFCCIFRTRLGQGRVITDDLCYGSVFARIRIQS